jgi:hypothetical protein
MLDDRVRVVLRRLEEETDRDDHDAVLPHEERSLQVPPSSRALLFALCSGRRSEVLELGGPRGYSTVAGRRQWTPRPCHSLEANRSSRRRAEHRRPRWIEVIPATPSSPNVDGPWTWFT